MVHSIFNNASSPAVAGTTTMDTSEVVALAHPVLSSVENDEDTMARYINLPDETSHEVENTGTALTNGDTTEKPVVEAPTSMLLKTAAEHEIYEGNANRKLTAMYNQPAESTDKPAPPVDALVLHRSPVPGPVAEPENELALSSFPNSLVQSNTHQQSVPPSGIPHIHLPTTMSISLTLLTVRDDTTSHLMVVPTSATFAEVLGRYIVQLPQGDIGHEALCDAASCTVKGVNGQTHKFAFREAGVERLWRAAVGRAARGLRSGDEAEDVVEVELF